LCIIIIIFYTELGTDYYYYYVFLHFVGCNTTIYAVWRVCYVSCRKLSM